MILSKVELFRLQAAQLLQYVIGIQRDVLQDKTIKQMAVRSRLKINSSKTTHDDGPVYVRSLVQSKQVLVTLGICLCLVLWMEAINLGFRF